MIPFSADAGTVQKARAESISSYFSEGVTNLTMDVNLETDGADSSENDADSKIVKTRTIHISTEALKPCLQSKLCSVEMARRSTHARRHA